MSVISLHQWQDGMQRYLSEEFPVVNKKPFTNHAGWSHAYTDTQGLQENRLNSLPCRCCLAVLIKCTPAIWLSVWKIRCRQSISLTRGHFPFASLTKTFFWHEKQCVLGLLLLPFVLFCFFKVGEQKIPTNQELERKIGSTPWNPLDPVCYVQNM